MADYGRTTVGASFIDIESDIEARLVSLPGGEPIEATYAYLQTTNGSTANVRAALLDPETGAPVHYSNQLSFTDDAGGWKAITWPATTPDAGNYLHAIGADGISGGANTVNIAYDAVGDDANLKRASGGTIGTYPAFQNPPLWDGPFGTNDTSFYLRTTSSGGGGAPTISGIDDVTLTHGQTGVTITGTGFSATGNEVIVSPTDDIDDPAAVAQTVTSESTTSIDFTADLDSFGFTTLYVFVRNADDESNADGEPISRIVASATLNFTGANFFFDENGDPVEMTGTLYVYRSPRPPTSGGTPDQIITSFETDSSGERSQLIALGSLEDGDRVFYLLFAEDGTEIYSAGEKLPDYA